MVCGIKRTIYLDASDESPMTSEILDMAPMAIIPLMARFVIFTLDIPSALVLSSMN
jgi:hypothetical protein